MHIRGFYSLIWIVGSHSAHSSRAEKTYSLKYVRLKKNNKKRNYNKNLINKFLCIIFQIRLDDRKF